MNLIARGQGKLDVARQLVNKSFAMWEKRQTEEKFKSAMEVEGVGEVLRLSAQDVFMNTLKETLQLQVDRRRAKFDITRLQYLLSILNDKENLKQSSKSLLSILKMLELEESTCTYLQNELNRFGENKEDDAIYAEMVNEDKMGILEQIEVQQERLASIEKEVRKHPFSTIATIANEILDEDTPESAILRGALRNARGIADDGGLMITAEELSSFAKSSVVAQRQIRKLSSANPDKDPQALLDQASRVEFIRDGSWDDMVSIVKTLVAYGCLEMQNCDGLQTDRDLLEKATYSITPAGENVGMLGFENSLWALVAVGGAWDVVGASANLDRFREAMESLDADEDFVDFENGAASDATERAPRAQQEAETLLSLVLSMTPGELAGYIAAIVAEGSRGSGPSVVELFHNLSPLQQRVIQSSLTSLERLADVQKNFDVDLSTRQITLDITSVQVVTAWANGCSWNEALQLSGQTPGDLARTLSRVLDAVRQLGNLPFTPVRKDDLQTTEKDSSKIRMPRGIHPEIRRLCRDAATLINRYPVKDPFSFEEAENDDYDDQVDDDLDDESPSSE